MQRDPRRTALSSASAKSLLRIASHRNERAFYLRSTLHLSGATTSAWRTARSRSAACVDKSRSRSLVHWVCVLRYRALVACMMKSERVGKSWRAAEKSAIGLWHRAKLSRLSFNRSLPTALGCKDPSNDPNGTGRRACPNGWLKENASEERDCSNNFLFPNVNPLD